MADLPEIRLPVDVSADPSSLADVTKEAERADAAVQALTSSVRKLNAERASGRTAATTRTPPTPEEQEQQFAQQRQRQQARQASARAASTPEARFEQYAYRAKMAQEQRDFARRLAPAYGLGGGGGIGGMGTPALLSAMSGGGGGALGAAGLRGMLSSVMELPGVNMAAIAAAAALAANTAITQQQANQLDLAAAVGGRYNAKDLNQQIIGAAGAFGADQSDILPIAKTLGAQYGMQQGQVTQAAASVLALSNLTGQKSDQLTPIVGGMGRAGMSGAAIDQSLGALVQQSRGSKVALDAMVESLKTLQEVTGGVAMDWRSMAGLAAALKAAGPGVNVGQLIAPAMAATGVNTLSIAASLGISVDQLQRMQGIGGRADPAALLRRQLTTLASRTAGYAPGMRLTAEELLAPSVGLDLSKLSPEQQAQLFAAGNAGRIQQAIRAMSAAPPGRRGIVPVPPPPVTVPGGTPVRVPIWEQGMNAVKRAAESMANDPVAAWNRGYYGPAAPVMPYQQPPAQALAQILGGPLGAAGNAIGGLFGAAGNALFGGGSGAAAPTKVDVTVHLTHDVQVKGAPGTTATVKSTATPGRVPPGRQPKGHVTHVH